MGLSGVIVSLARLCADEVVVPEEVGCCGFAGDRGFTHPEVNAYALRKLRPVVERSGVRVGYSNSRTCEIGLSARSGVPYVSIVYMVDACTTQKAPPEPELRGGAFSDQQFVVDAPHARLPGKASK